MLHVGEPGREHVQRPGGLLGPAPELVEVAVEVGEPAAERVARHPGPGPLAAAAHRRHVVARTAQGPGEPLDVGRRGPARRGLAVHRELDHRGPPRVMLVEPAVDVPVHPVVARRRLLQPGRDPLEGVGQAVRGGGERRDGAGHLPAGLPRVGLRPGARRLGAQAAAAPRHGLAQRAQCCRVDLESPSHGTEGTHRTFRSQTGTAKTRMTPPAPGCSVTGPPTPLRGSSRARHPRPRSLAERDHLAASRAALAPDARPHLAPRLGRRRRLGQPEVPRVRDRRRG